MNDYNKKQELNNCQASNVFQQPGYPSVPVFYSYMNIGIGNEVNITKEPENTIKIENKFDNNMEKVKHQEMEIKQEVNSGTSSSDTSPVKKEQSNDNFFSILHEEYFVVCDMCDFQSKSHREMDVHRLSHGLRRIDATSCHSLNEPNSMDPHYVHKIKKEHLCDMCPYSAKTSAQLVSHKKSHSQEKAYSCSQCSYKCKYLSGLKYHQLSHSNSKHFECSECKFSCMTAGLLKSHKRKHSNIAPYVCNLCTYRCKYPAGLRYHMLMHTKEKDISCDICKYTCRTTSELKIHLRKHQPQPMTCEYCGFTCKTKKTMTLHRNSGCRFQAT